MKYMKKACYELLWVMQYVMVHPFRTYWRSYILYLIFRIALEKHRRAQFKHKLESLKSLYHEYTVDPWGIHRGCWGSFQSDSSYRVVIFLQQGLKLFTFLEGRIGMYTHSYRTICSSFQTVKVTPALQSKLS